MAADVTGPLDAGEGLDFRPFVDGDRPVLGVEDDQGMDLRAGADKDVAAAAADGGGLFDRAFDAAAAGALKIFRQLGRVGKDQLPDVVPRRQPEIVRGEFLLCRGQDRVEGTRRQSSQVFAQIRAASTSPSASSHARLGPSLSFANPSAFTRASTKRRSAAERLWGSLAIQPPAR